MKDSPASLAASPQLQSDLIEGGKQFYLKLSLHACSLDRPCVAMVARVGRDVAEDKN